MNSVCKKKFRFELVFCNKILLKKKGIFLFLFRRERDSNPRYGVAIRRISNALPSASRSSPPCTFIISITILSKKKQKIKPQLIKKIPKIQFFKFFYQKGAKKKSFFFTEICYAFFCCCFLTKNPLNL